MIFTLLACPALGTLLFPSPDKIDSDFQKDSVGLQVRMGEEHGYMRARNYYDCIRIASEYDHLTEVDLSVSRDILQLPNARRI
jgi:hypothetical protein